MGGLKPASMKNMNTFRVEMFANHSTQPAAGMLVTTALTDDMQRDGTYRLAPSSRADFSISGEVTHITRDSLLADYRDSYLSREVGLTVYVRYTVRDARGQVVREGSAQGDGSYFADTANVQSSVSSALSQAAHQAAESITSDLTAP